MKLSKRIPARTKTVEFNWCRKDFMLMSPEYRRIRAKMSHPMNMCRWCGHKLADGEMMALAQPKQGKNWILCTDCADLLLLSEAVFAVEKVALN